MKNETFASKLDFDIPLMSIHLSILKVSNMTYVSIGLMPLFRWQKNHETSNEIKNEKWFSFDYMMK